MHIEKKERFLFLKTMNHLYSISVLENAVQTQEYVTKVISFFRYYTSEDKKLVRLKDEMYIVTLFAEVLAGMGGSLHIDFNAESEEASDIYIPARSLLFFVRDIFIQEDIGAGNLAVQVSSKENEIDVLMVLYSTGALDNRLASGIRELEKRFDSFYGSEIKISLRERNNALWDIFFKLPKEK